MKAMVFYTTCIVLLGFSSCSREEGKAQAPNAQASYPQATDQPQPDRMPSTLPHPEKGSDQVAFPAGDPAGIYTSRIIPSEGGTFGYEILKDGRPMIRQANIPGIPGNSGFTTEADAGKVAEAVISKLKKGEMPPTVSEEELKQLKVLK
jgi:hypothetical protein